MCSGVWPGVWSAVTRSRPTSNASRCRTPRCSYRSSAPAPMTCWAPVSAAGARGGGPRIVSQRILVLGGDGYLGWPTAMAFSRAGHRVAVVDNFAKRRWELEIGVRPLLPIPTLHERARAWREIAGLEIELHVGYLTDYAFVESVFASFRP